jgi:transcriptional regulator with XRE-family HTH domain
MAEGVSPTVARRRVRLALREAREGNGLTQGQVAEQMEWSLGKVIRIESGEVSISVNDLRPLLTFLGVNRAEIDSLVADARIARTHPLRMLPFYRDSPIANNADFDLISVGGGEMLYRENGFADEVVEGAVTTARHRERSDQLWHVADVEVDTIDFIRRRITALENPSTERRSCSTTLS